MRTRRDPRNGDPRLKTREWRRIVAAWQRLQPTQCEATPCRLPGIPITYTTPRTRTSLDVGHLTPRALDTRRVWTIDDTRPEHSHCNQSHGSSVKRLINVQQPVSRDEKAKSAAKW